MKYLILYFVLFFSFGSLHSQNRKIDSLKTLIKNGLDDTVKVKNLIALGWEYSAFRTDSLQEFSNRTLEFAKKLNWQKGQALAFNQMGQIYYMTGDNLSALKFYNNSFEIWEKLEKNDIKSKAYYINRKSTAAGNMAIVYEQQGDYSAALENYLIALRLSESINDLNLQSMWLGNIGGMYNAQNNYEKARDYQFKALEIVEQLGNKYRIAVCYTGIGNSYNAQKNYAKAIEYYEKALSIGEEIGEKTVVSKTLNNMASIYAVQNKSEKALEFFLKALKIDEEMGSQSGMAVRLGNIGYLYLLSKRPNDGEKYLLKALAIDTIIGYNLHTAKVKEQLSELYTEMGNHKKALLYFKQSSALKDTLFNEEKNKELTRYEMNYEFEKRIAVTKAEQDKKDAVTAAESKKQKIILILVSFVLSLVFIFAGFVSRSLKTTKKQKLFIELKNKETEEQKRVIEEKNKDIMDSIYYARRIQNSLLPTEKYLIKHFNQRS